MTKPLRLVDFDDDPVEIAYFENSCRGTFRDCPQKGTDPDMLLLALQISGLEYADDPLVTDGAMSLFQMLHNGTVDLDLMESEVSYRGYELAAYTGVVDKQCYYFAMPLQEPIVVSARRVNEFVGCQNIVNFFNTIGTQCVMQNRRGVSNNNEPYSFTEFLLDTFPWIYYVYLTLGIAAISTILKISQHERVESMLIEWPLRLLAVALRQPAFDRFSRNVRLSGLVAAAAGLLPFTIFAIYFDLNIKLLLAVPFQHQPPAQSIDKLIHAMKHGGYEFVMVDDGGYSPTNFSTPKQTAELEALADRFVVYPYDDDDDYYRSVTDPALKRMAMVSMSWSLSHCADALVSSDDQPYLYVKVKDITPVSTAFPIRRELYKERERLNRALALIQPAAINFPLKYDVYGFEYSLKLNPKYNNTVRFAQYRQVLIFFGAIYLGCILVVFLEIFLHKMANRVRMWHTLSTARI